MRITSAFSRQAVQARQPVSVLHVGIRGGQHLGKAHQVSGLRNTVPGEQHSRHVLVNVAAPETPLRSQTEILLDELAREQVTDEEGLEVVVSPTQQIQDRLESVRQKIDTEYRDCFEGLEVTVPDVQGSPVEHAEGQASDVVQPEADRSSVAAKTIVIDSMTEARFSALGREDPQMMSAILAAKQAADAEGWTGFQSRVRPLKLQRGRLEREMEDLTDALQQAAQKTAARAEAAARSAQSTQGVTASAPGGGVAGVAGGAGVQQVRIVMVTGFESFNVDLYKQAAKRIKAVAPHINMQVFSDRELTGPSKARVEAALSQADVFFGSLLFDFDQVEWLRERIAAIPVRLVFESALELMSSTVVGSFNMAPKPSGEKQGPPPVVKKVLGLFGSKREEDKMVGYLSFLKVGPKLLKFVPGNKAADLRHWLTIYSYWNQGGISNVQNMVLYLVENLVKSLPKTGTTATPLTSLITAPVETPPLGSLHPLYKDGKAYFTSPAQYWAWYQKEGPLRGSGAPVVGVLLYRKHVITEQPYIMQLISQMEQEGCIPVPVFINGVEAHTVVRDLLTSSSEQQDLAQGRTGSISPTLTRDAVRVDAVVSTIGFPLVGGPAGSMEAGRQADVAKTILASKNIPYVVAAPLLIQDMASWSRDGVAGLQSVVLYGLPELDGAIDTVPLGGLVGDNIFLVPERVKKMSARIRAWVNLRRKPPSERRVAVLVYGFPPGVGATGTAALLNVPQSLENLLRHMQEAGYDLGNLDLSQLSGEAVVTALAGQDSQRAVSRGSTGITSLGAGPAEAAGWEATAGEVGASHLRALLTYPPDWGPTEWGPIPFLPDNDVLVQNMEKQWGELRAYRGIMSSSTGSLVVPGVKAGKVIVGVQPVLGLEGDPMRLLFERDLTPHPQYAAFYKWLQHDYKADVVLHFGMHGTVEWLPGAPLGNTGLSWSDVLLGEMPNVYVYACNNPSESIIAKRRGYGTIVSHNVPPYGRAGLYKQLATLKELIQEWRETHTRASGNAAAAATSDDAASQQQDHQVDDSVRSTIFSNVQMCGLTDDVPFYPDEQSNLWEIAKRQRLEAAEKLAEQGSAAGLKAHSATTLPPRASPPPRMPGSPKPTRKAAHVLDRYSRAMEVAGARPGSPAPAKGKGAAPAAAAGPMKATHIPEGSLPLNEGLVAAMTDDEWGVYMSDMYAYLQTLENRLFSEGLHVLGQPPTKTGIAQYLDAYFDNALPKEAVEAVAESVESEGVETLRARLERIYQKQVRQEQEPQQTNQGDKENGGGSSAAVLQAALENPELTHKLEEAMNIRNLLNKNTEEMVSVMRALGGEYIPPEAGGDLLRDGAGVLPTGRNIHALDPYRMPSPAALERGIAAAQAILDNHRANNNGAYPETVAINLWGLDAIKTKGESVGMVLHMVGAVPVREGTGRIARYALLPLEELGRPRVDVLCNMSGIFRDSFQNVVELLDDLFQRAADSDEPTNMNFIRKHAQSMKQQGIDNGAARLFSNPAGDYGSMVNERVGAGNWDNSNELGDTWAARNSFSYGRGERGAARPEVLKSLLSTTDRIVQQVDSVEYGLTDIQEYYANTGALARAATMARGGEAVGVSIVEAFGKDPKPRELDQVLRLEYRSKLLNPKWAEAMANQGSGGAYEISQRMTAMVGWGATTGFSEKWAWDQAAQTYILDPEMSEKLKKANPQAFSNVLKRMLEAAGRGMWNANPDMINKLRKMYGEMDDVLEGVNNPPAGKK